MRDKRWYLDTSSVRRLRARLLSLSKPHHFRTSAFTLVELLNGILTSDKEYVWRSEAIKYLQRSRVAVRWVLPQPSLAAAFGFTFPGTDQRIAELRSIVDVVVTATERRQLADCIEAAGLSIVLNELSAYDDHIGNIGVNERGILMRTAFDQEKMNSDPPIPLDVLAAGFDATCDHFLSDEATVMDLARAAKANVLARMVTSTNSGLVASRLKASYNGAADLFLRADSVVTIQTQKNGGSRKRNDYSDLSHFLYFSKNTVLVSEDSGMRKLAGKIGIEAISAEELLR